MLFLRYHSYLINREKFSCIKLNLIFNFQLKEENSELKRQIASLANKNDVPCLVEEQASASSLGHIQVTELLYIPHSVSKK